MKKKVIAVVGATRAPGRGLVRAILDDASGEFVPRAVVRDADNEEARFLAAQGVEVVVGRIGLEASLRAAFAGANAAFYTMLPDEQTLPERKIGEATTLARAAKAAGLEHVVWANIDDGSQPAVAEEELTPSVGTEGDEPRKIDVKGEINKVFTNLLVPTTFLHATWRSPATVKWAEEIGKCAYGIFRSPELRNKTVSIDEAQLADALAKAAASGPIKAASGPNKAAVSGPNKAAVSGPNKAAFSGPNKAAVPIPAKAAPSAPVRAPAPAAPVRPAAPTGSAAFPAPAAVPMMTAADAPPLLDKPRNRLPLIVGGGAAVVAVVLILVLATGHKTETPKVAVGDVPPAAASNEPAAVAVKPTPAPPSEPVHPKVVALNSQGLRAPVTPPAARPQPEQSQPTLAMRSAPPPAPAHTRGHPIKHVAVLSKKRGHGGGEEEPRPIPAETGAPVRATPAADVRKTEARAPEPEPEAAPEAARPVEKLRESKTAVAVPHQPPPVTAQPLASAPAGAIDPKSVNATVRAHYGEVAACFERAQMDKVGLHGNLAVSAMIDPEGHVIEVSPTSSIEGGARLQSCVLSAFKGWVFAAPVGGVKGRIKYTFKFE